jgi:hypothetical protein
MFKLEKEGLAKFNSKENKGKIPLGLDWMPFSTPECLILLMPWSAWFHLK